MWRLWHKLFGWDYVALLYGYSYHTRRVKKIPDGKLYVKCYGEIFFVGEDGFLRTPDGRVRPYGKEYIPLTWKLETPKQQGNVVELRR